MSCGDSGYRWRGKNADGMESGDGRFGRGVVDENAAGFFPTRLVLQVVVDQDVAGVEVFPFLAGQAGDDAGAGEVLGSPGDLLRFGPSADRAAGEDDGVEMRDGIEELTGIGGEREMAIEAALIADPGPEGGGADFGFGFAGRHSEEFCGGGVEIGQDAIAVEEELGIHFRLP